MTNLNDRHDDEVVAHEHHAVTAVTASFAAAVARAVASIIGTRAMLATGDDPSAPLPPAAAGLLTRVAVRVLQVIVPDLRTELVKVATSGYRLGARQAHETILAGVAGAPDPGRLPDPDRPIPAGHDLARALNADGALVDVVDSADRSAQARLARAVQLAEQLPLDTETDVAAVAAQATSAVNQAKADTAWVATRSVARGSVDVAAATGAGRVWIAERDACLACLALSGHVVHDSALFPNITFGDRPLSLPAVPYPPRHPHCRCRVRPYTGPGPSLDMSATDTASALAREARRSVLKGWTGHESEPARRRAADRLIHQGAHLPRSVVARAARDLHADRFPTRPLPT